MSWGDALLLESLGQAIRGAGFAIPGSLGVQEGGYLLLAPLVGPAARDGPRAVAGQAGARGSARGCRVCCTCTCPSEAGAAASPYRLEHTVKEVHARHHSRRGSRHASATVGGSARLPKCLLSFDGTTLLERHLRILRKAGCRGSRPGARAFATTWWRLSSIGCAGSPGPRSS